MPLTTTGPALAQLLYGYLQPLAAPGGGDPKLQAWCNAVASAITDWLKASGTDAVSLVSGAVTTTGSPSAQAGPIVQFVGKIT